MLLNDRPQPHPTPESIHWLYMRVSTPFVQFMLSFALLGGLTCLFPRNPWIRVISWGWGWTLFISFYISILGAVGAFGKVTLLGHLSKIAQCISLELSPVRLLVHAFRQLPILQCVSEYTILSIGDENRRLKKTQQGG